MVRCSNCGAEVEDKFCTECGTKVDVGSTNLISNQQNCPNCGAEVEGSFCSHCGTKITSEDEDTNVSTTKFCPYCASEVNSNLFICPNCGHDFKAEQIAKEKKKRAIQEHNQKIAAKSSRSTPRIWIAGILSFFLPGLGHIIFKDYKKGLIIIGIGLLLEFLLAVIIGIYMFLVLFVYGLGVLAHLYVNYIEYKNYI